MVEWSEDYVTAICPLILTLDLVGGNWLNWISGGALRWKVEIVDWEGQEV
jgi:hypothetical protein